MDLVIKIFDKNIYSIKPVISKERNIESIIARIKIVIFEKHEKNIILDLTEVNFLDCIKIGTIVGTYHFLEFSGKKIYILVNDIEVKKALEILSFNNIEINCEINELAIESIA